MQGKVTILFLKKTVPTLYGHLMKLAQGLSLNLENVKAFYQLLFLLTLEFSEPGVLDMVLYLNSLQQLAVDSELTLAVSHRNALHAIVAGILFLITKISSPSGLQEHILQILALRRASAIHLLPEGLFGDSPVVKSNLVDQEMLFILDQDELHRKSPEPKKSFGQNDLLFYCVLVFLYELTGRFGRESSSSGPDLTSHFSVSLDYGDDSPLSIDQISFNSLKEKASSGEERFQVNSGEQDVKFSGALSFQEAVGKVSDLVNVT